MRLSAEPLVVLLAKLIVDTIRKSIGVRRNSFLHCHSLTEIQPIISLM